MKKGQVYEGIVERVDFPNKGIVRTGDETAIVKNSLPGQKVRFRVSKVRKGKAEGRLLEVMETSPLETGHPCSLFGICGGCTYLSLPYGEQLRVKEEQVKRLLDGVLTGRQQPWLWEGIKGSPQEYEYRNKMEFSFGDSVKDGPLELGMHRRGNFYDIVTVSDCRIMDEDYRTILEAVRGYFGERKVSFFHRGSHEGFLRHLLVRKASGTGEILVALVTTSQSPWKQEGEAPKVEESEAEAPEAEAPKAEESEAEESEAEAPKAKVPKAEESETEPPEAGCAAEGAVREAETTELVSGFCDTLLSLEREGRLTGKFAGILHITNDSVADVVKSDRTDILYGQDYFFEELLGLRFKISVFSFFQTNSHSAAVLYRTAREYVGDVGAGQTVFDLYSGTGTIAQLMAPVAKQVIGVEIVEEAVEAAKKNAVENGLKNCTFIAGDVLRVLDELEEKPDIIILDPPRDGIHPKALGKIIRYGVERIVYISCKPTSLTRDLEAFLESGYEVVKAVAVDQFPWTANCEVCVELCRKIIIKDKQPGK